MTLASGYFVLTPIWHEIVIGLIAFGALFFVLSKVLLPRLEKVYAERHDRIEGGFERAEQARAEAKRVQTEYRTRIGEARDEAARIRDAAREEGQRRHDEVLANAREESAGMVSQGREELATQRSSVASDLQPDVARLSRRLAGRMLGREIGDDEYRQVVDEYQTQRV
ncbi:ATP synthase F0 subcomplex B subunit [Actinomycetospora succinea]|uniref:ATP synthase subunit b n=1 Tax=Actinomycetospora succinea TaxID=663603 RepID=A0A4V3D9Q5_9PSEU|nr:F0F1 ATP synthase subunit B [Actinomycetospora succinea]TDQ58352.1 ATP synthase F0 subcomplex B subunit [Actinomycetospora succinea]